MYYLTCSGIGLTGAFTWSTSKTIFETGLSTKDLLKTKSELSEAGLVLFFENWIIIPGTEAKTGYSRGSEITTKAYENELVSLPDEVKNILSTPAKGYTTPSKEIDRGTPTPINQKSEISNGDKSVREGDQLDDEFCLATAKEFAIASSEVRKKCLAFEDYCASKGKRYKSKRATVRGWIRNDIRDGKIKHILPTDPVPYNLPKPEDRISADRMAELRGKMKGIL